MSVEVWLSSLPPGDLASKIHAWTPSRRLSPPFAASRSRASGHGAKPWTCGHQTTPMVAVPATCELFPRQDSHVLSDTLGVQVVQRLVKYLVVPSYDQSASYITTLKHTVRHLSPSYSRLDLTRPAAVQGTARLMFDRMSEKFTLAALPEHTSCIDFDPLLFELVAGMPTGPWM
jgi:hypothetical protein